MNYQETFYQNYGYSIEEKLDNETIQSFLTKQHTLMEALIGAYNPKFDLDRLNDTLRAKYDKAFLVQIEYALNNVDMSNLSGINFANNQVLDLRILKERYISPVAQMLLMKSGLLYRGI